MVEAVAGCAYTSLCGHELIVNARFTSHSFIYGIELSGICFQRSLIHGWLNPQVQYLILYKVHYKLKEY